MFVYFDLGNVLLNFDHGLMCRQMANVVRSAGGSVSAEQVKTILFEDRHGRRALQWRFERGEVSADEFYKEFCAAVATEPDRGQLAGAANRIFSPNVSMRVVLGSLLAARQPLGLLSNTNELHWDYVVRQQDDRLIPSAFRALALSFEIQCMKPEPEIFRQAASLAGVPPHEIFYVDDIASHVMAARDVGFDAVQYTTTSQFVADLRRRGIGLNY
ncbi:MAG: HAD family phosphatase [Pirellulales bacterium]|nr:HAD family phosphatase [Pirellulales bacterium]